jgi:hypothetical protein
MRWWPRMVAAAAGFTEPCQARLVRSPVLDLYLALCREVNGRATWEFQLLPRPHVPAVGEFDRAVALLRRCGVQGLEARLAQAQSVSTLADRLAGLSAGAARRPDVAAKALRMLTEAMMELSDPVEQVLAAHAPELGGDADGMRQILEQQLPACLGFACQALGLSHRRSDITIYLTPATSYRTPATSFPPGSGNVAGSQEMAGGFVDCGRFCGSDMAEAVLNVAVHAMIGQGPGACGPVGGTPVWDELADHAGIAQARSQIRNELKILLVDLTLGEAVRAFIDSSHFDAAAGIGVYLHFSGLIKWLRPLWRRYLNGDICRQKFIDFAVSAMAEMDLGEQSRPPLATAVADFYILELLASDGDDVAGRVLAVLETELAEAFTHYIEVSIGAELGHEPRQGAHQADGDLREFLIEVRRGDSRLAWNRVRHRLGLHALTLAEQVFSSSVATGGVAWVPIVRLLRLYLSGTINARVFIDQSFTIKHNTGPIFDKFLDVTGLQAVLDAQAAGDIATMLHDSSKQTRRLWARAHALRRLSHDSTWLGVQQDVTECDIAKWAEEYGWTEQARRSANSTTLLRNCLGLKPTTRTHLG